MGKKIFLRNEERKLEPEIVPVTTKRQRRGSFRFPFFLHFDEKSVHVY